MNYIIIVSEYDFIMILLSTFEDWTLYFID